MAMGARKRIAFLGTVIFEHSHAQHFLDRLHLGYNWNGAWQDPRVDIASVYIEQFPQNDIGKQRLAKYGYRNSASIADALTLGTGRLAVDGVVIIAEHGDYPNNEMGQKLYPRYDWYKQVIDVFEKSGRSVPVFNDKHLSTSWSQCAEMVADCHRLKFKFLAGSSLPVTRRMPAIDMPHGVPLTESVCVGYGGVDSYDFHALETAQCMSERRRGGETGIRSCIALKGKALWEFLSRSDRADTRKLMVAALTRDTTTPLPSTPPASLGTPLMATSRRSRRSSARQTALPAPRRSKERRRKRPLSSERPGWSISRAYRRARRPTRGAPMGSSARAAGGPGRRLTRARPRRR
jgi:hypothetical protein